MDVLLVLAILVAVRLTIGFFGPLAATTVGAWYLGVTHALVPPIAGAWAVRTPYGGVFSVDAGIVIVVLLVAEWLLATVAARPSGRRTREDRPLEHH
jgi:hypothetical protein